MFTKKIFFLFVVLILSLHNPAADANQSDESRLITLLAMSLDELVELEVTVATGTAKTLKLAPAVATVITAQDIERIGSTTLDEVLETVPGLHVSISEFYAASIWSIRGIHTSLNQEVLLLINGIPLKNIQSGRRPFGFQMPVSMISRIEIIRGPGSAVYGADAFSGVINVITRDSKDINGTEAGFRGGSFDTYDGWIQHGGTYSGFDIAIGIEGRKTEGDDDRIIVRDRLGAGPPSLTPAPVDTRSEIFDGHLNVHKENLTFNFYASMLESALGLGGVQTVTYGNEVDGVNFLSDLTYHNETFFTNWDLSAQLYTVYMHQDLFLDYYPKNYLNMMGNPIVTHKEAGCETVAIYNGWDSHKTRLALGLSHWNIDIDQYKNFSFISVPPFVTIGEMRHITDPDEIFMKEEDRTVWHVSLQDEWSIAGDWDLTAGIRFDEYSDFGSTTNPRLALIWQTTDHLIAKFLYGQAFLAPNFGQLYNINNPVGIGNPDLAPEEIETLELALDYRPLSDLNIKLNLFTYKAERLIEYIGSSPQIASNYGEQEGNGFELEFDWRPSDSIRVYSNFAYQHAEVTRSGATVHDAPEVQFLLNPHWEFLPEWSVDSQAYWIGQRNRKPEDPREDIDDYWLVHLTLRKKNILKHLDLALAVRNLFNEDAREPSPFDPNAPFGAWIAEDYPLQGREFWAELRFTY